MTSYLIRRLGMAVGVLWAAFTLSFFILYLLPGDPVATMASGGLDGEPPSPAELAALRARYGFDQPVPVQYWHRLCAALHGNFGSSFQSGQDVRAAIAHALPPTARLAAAAVLLAVLLGGALGLGATFTRLGWLRQLLLSLPPLAVSLPTFWVGLMLVQVFAYDLRWLPSVGTRGASSLILPTVTLALPNAALLAQVLAKSMSRVLGEAYVVTARAKGLSRPVIHLRHALRNASLPSLTVLGYLVGNVLASSVVVETVFNRPGLGRLTVQAVSSQDIPLVAGIVVFVAAVFVTANLVVDLLYPVLDPRVASVVPA